MNQTDPNGPILFRFGDFELDARAREVRRAGSVVDLRGQPVLLLALLVARAGEVVTREELRKALWDGSTFVDFDHGVHSAMNRIREALGDSARQPAFIETIPRVGYRFIAPVYASPATVAASDKPIRSRRVARLYRSVATALLTFCAVSAVWLWQRVVSRTDDNPAVRYLQLTHDGRHKEGLLCDGQRLYTVEESGGGFVLTEFSIRGGDPRSIPVDLQHPALVDIATDGTELLLMDISTLQADLPLWVQPLPTGSPHRLSSINAQAAAWSPDGRWLAYSSGNALYRANHDGTDPNRIAFVPGRVESITWSPDSRTIRFTVSQASGGSYSLWQSGIDGRGLSALFPGWTATPRDCCGRWTAGGKHFVFLSAHDGKPNLWAIDERRISFGKQRSTPRQWTAGPVEFSSVATGKSDDQIFTIGQLRRGELVSYEPKQNNFVPFLSGLSADGISFSSDRRWVAYTSYPDGTLWCSRSDLSHRRQLSFPPMRASLPAWSPDGRSLAFIGELPGQPLKIFIVSAGGGMPKALISSGETQVAPTWLPDSERLVFGTAWWLETKPTKPLIRIFNLHTHELATIAGSEGLGAPRVSPDGRYICALTHDLSTLKLFDFQKNRWTVLAHGKFMSPNWSHDSRYIYFNNLYFDEAPAVFRVSVPGGKIERVVALAGLIRVALGNWNPFTALTPDDRVLLLRDAGNEEIYSVSR